MKRLFAKGACRWLLGGSLLLAGLLAALASLWLNFQSSSEFNGRYQSAGNVVQSDGTVLEVIHSLLIKDGHFYAMTRQGQTILRTSGSVESGFFDRLRLRVEKGEVTELEKSSSLDNDLLFNLLYASEQNSTLNLRPIGHCYLAVETRQVYCPSNASTPRL
ncbi:hypothetical protein A9179_06095 [Pseudomonas alcaligenes]|uniref:Uncharacterized protein n=1 Tax=Aquipseudomonas alcaligenes TaxID=43263 RepID=A0ABR7S038_AQUAC|nr:hypothetical protein [Pseudomonas alcaligenes]MBC9249843.1 hypothetical protein [Pseudomonas alcaligenes]